MAQMLNVEAICNRIQGRPRDISIFCGNIKWTEINTSAGVQQVVNYSSFKLDISLHLYTAKDFLQRPCIQGRWNVLLNCRTARLHKTYSNALPTILFSSTDNRKICKGQLCSTKEAVMHCCYSWLIHLKILPL